MLAIVSNIFLILIILLGSVEGYKLRLLTRSGSMMTVIVGTAIVIGFGFNGLLLIMLFFGTSSYWSRYKRERKKTAEEKNEKTGARDGAQVLANGGAGAIYSLLYFYFQQEIWLYLFIAAIAAANSDTWASEIGSTSKKKPLHILSFKKVEQGTSGAMSLLGTNSAIAGALMISIISYFLWSDVSLKIALLIGLAGFLGNLVDTLLGATIQVTYRCRSCQLITEKTMHCGIKTEYNDGLRLFNNDFVNFLSIVMGSLFILILI